MRSFVKHRSASYLFAFFSSILLLSCSSSDTRSQAKSSTSGEFEINVQITSPVDGAVVAFTVKSEGEDPTADVTFTFATTGGTEPVTVTWLIEGPNTSNSSTGADGVLTFQESGEHTITALATDARGLTDSDAIKVFVIL